jgi:4-hydroxybenzoate polyprenyltransferase
MAVSFSLISSAFYLLNDISDYESDRLHPVKRLRPIAADLISKIDAVRVALALYACSLAFPAYLVFHHPDRTWGFAVILIYTVMQSLYSGLLKRIGYVDVAVIAAGFVLRAVAGAAAMDVRISPWLLWCAFLISMFLALCKRRHEKAIACESRAALASYHPVILDTLIIISALATFGVYLWYTLSADTVARFRTRALSITSIFVALGIIRYLYLLFTKKDVGRPEKILLSDKIIWLILFGYSISAVLAVWSGR